MEYARAVAVYKELRAILGPWAKDNGYKRQRGGDAAWTRALGKGEDVVFTFRCNAWGSGATGGSSFHGCVQTETSGSAPATAINRQADVSLCLLEAELDELRQIQNIVNRRRPRTPETTEWMREDSPLGEHTRQDYKQFARGEKPYRPGDFATFGYYSLADVRLHADFLRRRLPDIVARFLDRRVATPNPVPQPAFMAKLAPRS